MRALANEQWVASLVSRDMVTGRWQLEEGGRSWELGAGGVGLKGRGLVREEIQEVSDEVKGAAEVACVGSSGFLTLGILARLVGIAVGAVGFGRLVGAAVGQKWAQAQMQAQAQAQAQVQAQGQTQAQVQTQAGTSSSLRVSAFPRGLVLFEGSSATAAANCKRFSFFAVTRTLRGNS
eukprot:CAMPEP_0173198420 /NCGR_PEP_ID=MMETSP1141-20130122/16677_1 /TAXON_ID=483371 /ORGANISM="non described non described, Strain CCMP2298" /LENGTH=177 /DNA_ID=CAMNT_0014123211 /DNA_START=38 /DNA_END=573 /DNA_ORIENTATION=-